SKRDWSSDVCSSDLIIKFLRSVLVRKKLNVVLEYRLIPFLNPQIKCKQRGSVRKKFFRISDRIRKMIISYPRLCKRGVNKVIGCRVLSFEKIFDIELIIRLKVQNLCIFQFYAVNILPKLRIGVIPKYKLTNVTCELAI